MDFILNGQAHGDVAQTLMANNMDPNALRPWIGADGHVYRAVKNAAGVYEAVRTHNTTATLRKDDWKHLDAAVVKASKPRLKAVGDLRSKGLTYNLPNGMGKTILETETMSDISDAEISMDGLRQSKSDRPEFELSSLPLPIISKDFQYSLRQVMASRNGGSPLDTTTAELAGAKVAEQAEKLLLGTYGSYAFGGGTIYGYTNYPTRMTASITAPTTSGWTGADLLDEILGMRQDCYDAYHYGPYMVYTAPAWDQYLDGDFSTAKGDITLRERIEKVSNIQGVMTLDHLTGWTILLVQMSSDVIREVIGMDITTVQWETKGGLQLNFKVMAILIPQLRADINSKTGIVHGS